MTVPFPALKSEVRGLRMAYREGMPYVVDADGADLPKIEVLEGEEAATWPL